MFERYRDSSNSIHGLKPDWAFWAVGVQGISGRPFKSEGQVYIEANLFALLHQGLVEREIADTGVSVDGPMRNKKRAL